MTHRTVEAAGCILTCLLACVSLFGQQFPSDGETAQSLKELTLEELSNIEVTTVGRRPEPVWRSAAAVYPITADEIRRSGVRSIPEALRLATGLQVARSSNSNWAISARGFNITTANKMQVFVDGRSMYSPLFGGVLWDQVDMVLADIDRIEVIRGPASTMWGGNAVNGVINIVTKSSSQTQGTFVEAGGGSNERGFITARYGDLIGLRTAYRVYGKFDRRGSLVLASGGDAENPFTLGQTGFRSDILVNPTNQVTIQGDLYSGQSGTLNQDDTGLHGANLLGRWTRNIGSSELQLQAYWDRTSRLVPTVFDEVRNSYDVDGQQQLPFYFHGRHDLVWGFAYRNSQSNTKSQPVLFFVPNRRRTHLFSLFAEDQLGFRDGAVVVRFGSKIERNSYSGWDVHPTARLSWTPTAAHNVWMALSRAVRIPTQFDTDLRIQIPSPTGLVEIRGDREFQPEKLISLETGYRALLTSRLIASLFGHYNWYDDLRSQERPEGGAGPTILGNGLQGRSYGVETTLLYRMLPWWRFQVQYANLQVRLEAQPGSTDLTGGRSEALDPRNQFAFRSSMELPLRTEVDFWLRHVSALHPNPPTDPIPAYTVFDLRLGWRPQAQLELSVTGRNLPKRHHAEFTGGQLVRREVYGTVTWTE